MYIQCPHCRTLNECDDAPSLSSDEKYLRCHHCRAAINIPPALSAIFANPLRRAIPIPVPDDDITESALNTELHYSEFTKSDQIHPRHASASGWWIMFILGLLAIFTMQYGYFMRNDLARHDMLRPWLEKLCVLAACEIPMKRDISKIIIINRDISSIPDTENILQVNITLENTASYIQPFPKMQLSFSDINGRKIASRRFKPDEYLSEQLLEVNKGMPPQVPVIASLQILDPGEQAITFEFEFF